MSASTPYGPNTAQIRRFLQRLAALSASEWGDATRAYAELEATPRFRAADRALGAALERANRSPERDAAMGPLLRLVRAADAGEADDGDGDEPALDPVAEPALGAVLALLARDLLPEETVRALYSPFAALIPMERLGE